jgi:hypothetical protein
MGHTGFCLSRSERHEGWPFNPQGKTKAAMERAVVDAYFYLQERDMKMLNGLLY